MVATIVSAFSTNRLDSSEFSSLFQAEINFDDKARLACMEKNLRAALAFRPWGHELDTKQLESLEWWLRLCNHGFPTHEVKDSYWYEPYTHQCGFDCIDWERGYGFGCGYVDTLAKLSEWDTDDDYDMLAYHTDPWDELVYGNTEGFLALFAEPELEPAFELVLPSHKLEHPRFKGLEYLWDDHGEPLDHTKVRRAERPTKWDTCRDRKQRVFDKWLRKQRLGKQWWQHYCASRTVDADLLSTEPVTYEPYAEDYDDYSDPYYWDTDDDPFYWHPSEIWWGYGLVTEYDFADDEPMIRSGWNVYEDPYAPKHEAVTETTEEDDVADVTWLTPHKYEHPRFSAFSKCYVRESRRFREESYRRSQRTKRRRRIEAGIADRGRATAA